MGVTFLGIERRSRRYEVRSTDWAVAFIVNDMVAHQPTRLLVRPMTEQDAGRVAAWRYRDRWSVYDLRSSADILDELHLYWAVVDPAAEILVGFVCVEAAARVPGLDTDSQFIDVGVGMHPDLVGQDSGSAFGATVLDHVAHRYPGRPLRSVIQAWNERSLRFAARLGFTDVGELVDPKDRRQGRYRILVQPKHS